MNKKITKSNILVCRLKPKTDLKKEIIRIAKTNNVTSGCIINAVGSLSKMVVRTDASSEAEIIKEYGKVEVVSLIGTIGDNGQHVHIHISGGDISGNVFGGHLSEGCIVKTTIELMILVFQDLRFLTELDESTGFKELLVQEI